MARVSPIQESFAAGEIDERLRGHVSLDAYAKGLKRARNWYPLVQGPMRMREGSMFKSEVDVGNWVSQSVSNEGLRVFTFQRGLDEDAIIEVGENQIIIRNSITGDQLVGGVTGNLLPDPTFNLGFPSGTWLADTSFSSFNTLPALQGPGFATTGPGDGPGVRAQINGQGHDPATEPNGWRSTGVSLSPFTPIIIPSGSELLLNELSINVLVFVTDDQLAVLGGTFPLPDPVVKIRVGTISGAADVLDVNVPIPDRTVIFNTLQTFIPGAGNNTLFLSIGLFWTGAIDPVPDLTFDVNNDIQRMGMNVYNDWTWFAPLAGGSGSDVEFTTPWTVDQFLCLQFCMDPGEQEGFFTHPEVETQRLRFAIGEWTFEGLTTITLPTPYKAPDPDNWAPGNFPAACTFHEGRLWLGGSPNDPATLWASRSGDYVDFTNTAPASKDDPLLFPLSNSGNVQTLTSRKDLVILTDISEVIGTSIQGVIAFDDFSFPKQTDWGSNCIQPVVVGRSMVFTSNSRTRIRTFADEGGTNYGWDGNELSLLAQSIFKTPVRRLVYLDEPAYQACFLLSDGTMGMATYFYPEDVIGWWRYTTSFNGDRTSGDTTKPGLGNQTNNVAQQTNRIMDITKINTSSGAKLWMLINRVGMPNAARPFHELLGFESGIRPALDQFIVSSVNPTTLTALGTLFMDSYSLNAVVEVVDPFTSEISYVVHPNVTAILNETSVFEPWAAGQTVFLGLFYDNDWQLLSREGVSQRGTSQVSKRRWNKVFARLNDSPVPIIEGIAARDRTPSTPMGTGEPFITGDTDMVDLGSGEADIKITQDKPLITEVSAIFGKVISEEV